MKIKINDMETNSNLSDDEIRSYMNFDKLVDHVKMQSGRRRLRHLWIALPVVLALVSVWLIVDNHQQSESSVRVTEPAVIHADSDLEQRQNPGVSGNRDDRRSEGKDSIDAFATRPGSPSRAAAEKHTQDPQRGVPESQEKSTGSEATAPLSSQADRIANDTYVQAEPRLGYTHLYAYFNEHLSYPPQAVKDSVTGVETVSFTINERGRPVNITITHSLGPDFDQEAIRLIREMPDWTPATLNGSPVASQLSVPLTFQVKRLKKP